MKPSIFPQASKAWSATWQSKTLYYVKKDSNGAISLFQKELDEGFQSIGNIAGWYRLLPLWNIWTFLNVNPVNSDAADEIGSLGLTKHCHWFSPQTAAIYVMWPDTKGNFYSAIKLTHTVYDKIFYQWSKLHKITANKL